MTQFPVYTASSELGESCGHQHATPKAAARCADNLAQQHPARVFTVFARHADGSSRSTGYSTRLAA